MLPTQIILPGTLQVQCMRWQFCSHETGTQGNERSHPSLGTSKLGLVFLRVILEIAFLCPFDDPWAYHLNKATKGVDVHSHIMFKRWEVFSRQVCYDTCIGPSLRSSSQPISIWAFLSDSFTFVVQTSYCHTQSSYFLPFCRRRHLNSSNAMFTFTWIVQSPGDEKMGTSFPRLPRKSVYS